MKFIVSSSYLLKQLQVLGSVINNNHTMPILENFLFELNQSQLTVSASDLETKMSATLEIESESEGKFAVQAKLLLDMLKTFPEQPLTFTVENAAVEISSNSGKYALSAVSGEDFPDSEQLQDPSSVSIPAEILATAITKTIFATGNDELRLVMMGVLFEFSPEGLTFVATDAHKLVKYERTDVKSSEEAAFVMPKKPLNILKNILQTSDSEVKIEYNKSNATFSFDNVVLTCRLIDGTYPKYNQVIPKENPNKLIIDRNLFLTSVKRVSIFSSRSTHQIRLKIAGAELNISAEDVEYSNKADERMTCDYQGDDILIGFNSKFLLEMLNTLTSDEIQLEMSLPNRAGILTPVDGLDEGEKVMMLVMPVMINS
ncbi:DNA polymerase III subunit beta [Flavobacterium aurantiibacter]|uniref:Beta sliding clamp n=1 Tax=Flavobacterium aurantiibacter TaxID=2023067 RepID=A0A256A2W1_9FLAO|nr:DNA polymerase III subunit beta [Flavobacterium aurantiibacter]OYQ48056.1 DNA polymerase III subunit beta [Flavobacterium aurantiibacter]